MDSPLSLILSPFTPSFLGTLRAVKELWLEEVQVVVQAVAADSRCWSLAQFEVVMLAFGACQKDSGSMEASA